MARAKKQRRQKGVGTISRRGGSFFLLLRVHGKAVMRVIVNAEGKNCTSIEAARDCAPALADAIRAEVNRNLAGEPVGNLAEVYQRYLATYSKRKGRPHVDSSGRAPIAPRTLTANLRYIGAFVAWLRSEYPAVKMVEAISREHAAGYLATLGDLRPSSFNRALMALRHVFNVVPYGANPFAALSQKSKTEVDAKATGKRAFTIEELATMQQKAKGWVRPAMFVGYHSGLRLGDVVTLRWDEVDGEGYIRRVQRKSGKTETIYCPEVQTELEAWRREQGTDAGEYVFPYQAAAYLGIGRTVDQTLPGKQFQRFLAKECKLATHDSAGAVILGFHSLRASNATYGRRSGQTVAEVQKRLAHTSATTTAGYIQLTDDDVRRELKATHRALPQPGATVTTDPAETADRERFAAAAWTLPIAEIRSLLRSAIR